MNNAIVTSTKPQVYFSACTSCGTEAAFAEVSKGGAVRQLLYNINVVTEGIIYIEF